LPILPQDLCKIIDYYAILIEILRSKLPEKITYTVADKAKIARAGHEIKNHLGQTINLVTPATIMRWFRELKSGVWFFYNNACAKTGRPPISPVDCALSEEICLSLRQIRLLKPNHSRYFKELGPDSGRNRLSQIHSVIF